MIRFACPQCGKGIQVKPELAGRKGKCPGCQSILVIPAASQDPAGFTPSAPQSGSPPAAQPPPSRQPPPRESALPREQQPSEPVSQPNPFAPESPAAASTDFDFDFQSGPASQSPRAPSSAESFAPSDNPYASTGSYIQAAPGGQNTGLPLGLGIGSLVCGLFSIICGCCIGIFQLPVALVGVGLGIGGIVNSKGHRGASRVLPIIGTIISSVGLLLGIVILTLYFFGGPMLGDSIKEAMENRVREMEIEMEEMEAIEEEQEEIDPELQQELEEMRRQEQEALQPFSDDGNDPFAQPEE